MTTERTDLYAILGVAPHATHAEISRAYRALLRRHHPDTRAPADESQRAGSDTTLQQVLAAYTVLRDPTRRADYDRQARPRIQPARPLPQHALNHYSAHRQAPIVAGPVRWHPGVVDRAGKGRVADG
jgi:curved DNA-binding protein CbpA